MALRPHFLALPLAVALAAIQFHARLSAADESSGRVIGTFRVTYYYVAEEARQGSWPLYAPACKRVLARTSREFHHALSLEGTGRLLDGRLLNFSERCSCARPGHGGSRICYEELNPREYPWGRGARVHGHYRPLAPFRSVAVDPAVIPFGTVLFIPAWRGRRWPDGSVSDGCFRAEDSGRLVKRRHLDLFAGTPLWAKRLERRDAPRRAAVYVGAAHCR